MSCCLIESYVRNILTAHRSTRAPIMLEFIDPSVPYVKISVMLNKNPPIKEPIIPAIKSPHRPPKLSLREIMPATPPKITPTNKSQSNVIALLIIVFPLK